MSPSTSTSPRPPAPLTDCVELATPPAAELPSRDDSLGEPVAEIEVGVEARAELAELAELDGEGAEGAEECGSASLVASESGEEAGEVEAVGPPSATIQLSAVWCACVRVRVSE